jgi:PAS domain S-box-containing protein
MLVHQLEDAFFRALFNSELGGIAVADLSSLTIVDINETLLRTLGRAKEEIVGVPNAWMRITPPEFLHLDEKAILQIQSEGHSEPFEKEYFRPDGTRVPVRVSGASVPGYDLKIIIFVTDITAERAAREREETASKRLQIAISAAQQGVWDWDLITGEMVYSDRAKEIYGLSPEEPVRYELVRDATHPEDLPQTSAQLKRAIDPDVRDRSSYEYRILRRDGTVTWALAYGEALFAGPAGDEKAIRYAGTIQDITARKEAERYRELLIAELNHRVKNTLAVVQSLAHQTFSRASAPTEAIPAFEARLTALATAHNLLTRENWDAAALRDVVAEVVVLFSSGEQFQVDGPEVRLPPRQAVSLTLALHELATNAQKYGALRGETGSVTVRWRVIDDRLQLVWTEQGGPEVVSPTRTGFGTRLLKRALAADLGGDVEIDFRPEGLVCNISWSRLP